MSRLVHVVRNFVRRAKSAPADASDPRLLEEMLRVADRSQDEAASVLVAPRADDTLTARVLLRSVNNTAGMLATSQRIPVSFAGPVEIVGFKTTVIRADQADDPAATAVVEASSDTIDVSVDLNNQLYKTNTGITTTAGLASQFSTLGALDIREPRVLCWDIKNAKPEVGFRFRFSQANTTELAYRSCLVSVDLFVKYPDPRY